MFRVYLSVGSNIGNRGQFIRFCIDRIKKLPNTIVLGQSCVYETEPVGCPPGTAWFLNTVLLIKTKKKPEELLRALQLIEQALDREVHGANMPRTIDIDIIFYGSKIIDTPALQIPHPRFRERKFVLIPLMELEADLIDPKTKKTVRELLETAQDNNTVRKHK